jgi:adenylate cyclase
MSARSWQALLAELKRRRVFRAAAVYGAAAFVVIQAADLIFPRLALPDWTITLVVVLALLGLVPALALAWAFDATADGVRRTEPATHEELASILAQPRARRWPAGLAALAGIALLAGGAWLAVGRGEAARADVYDSIAVLPFANMSGDPENEYFGDGLAEELLNALAGIEGLKVAARTSAFAFKGTQTDVRTIGDTLRVATVLEGSVRRSADRIRITAQLIDARTGFHLWSETYDRPLADIFVVQDAIAAEIVNALAVRLTGGVRADQLYRGGTSDVDAYDLYLLGRQKWATRQIPLLHEALAHFEQAIARDSSFALAWSGLADVIDALAWRNEPGARARVSEGIRAAMRAIILEPELAEGWASLGILVAEFESDWYFAELALRRAVQLKPSYATAHLWLGNALLYAGRAEEALVPQRTANTLDPLSPLGASVVLTLQALRRWDEARAASLRYRDVAFASQSAAAVRLVSNAVRFGFTAEEAATYAREWAALAEHAQPADAEVVGRAVLVPELRDSARVVLRRAERTGIRPRDLAELQIAIGDTEAAIVLLQRALEEGEPTLIQIGVDPTFDPLRADPRFVRLITTLRVPNGVMR